MAQLSVPQAIPTTNQLIQGLRNDGLAMRRGGAEHMMRDTDQKFDNDDDEQTTRRENEEQLKMELEFLKQLPKKMKHRLVKRLKHLEKRGAIHV